MPCALAMAFWSSARTTIEPTEVSRIRVSEIIPDKILDMVDEIEAMDIPHDDLLNHLRDDKVYLPTQTMRRSFRDGSPSGPRRR